MFWGDVVYPFLLGLEYFILQASTLKQEVKHLKIVAGCPWNWLDYLGLSFPKCKQATRLSFTSRKAKLQRRFSDEARCKEASDYTSCLEEGDTCRDAWKLYRLAESLGRNTVQPVELPENCEVCYKLLAPVWALLIQLHFSHVCPCLKDFSHIPINNSNQTQGSSSWTLILYILWSVINS